MLRSGLGPDRLPILGCLRFTSLLAPERKYRIAAFLPASCVGRGQILTENPVVGILQHMSLDTFGVHNVII
ncbi:MAG: hypothetical protein WCD86_17990 [Ktedonobacteraceae bacterium]